MEPKAWKHDGEPASGPVLSLRNIEKSYNRGRHELRVLRDVSLDVHAGELVAVVAQHGAGKTTLLKIAAGIEAPDDGEALLDGESLRGLPDPALSRLLDEQIAWVAPTPPEGDTSIVEDVALPLLARLAKVDAYERARQALDRAGIGDCAQRPWAELLDRERSLAAIARGIARKPRLLLVDEPATALDISDTDEVTWLLRRFAEDTGAAILMTASDAPAALRAHHITTLAGGRLSKPPRGAVLDFPDKGRSGRGTA